MADMAPFAPQAIFVRLAGRILRGARSVTTDDLRQLRQLLFLQYEAPLGSNVHITPVFEAIKKAVPDTRIAVACSGLAVEVLKHNPFIDDLLITSNPLVNTADAMRSLRHQLRKKKINPECVVTTSGNTRSRITLCGMVAGRSLRVGYTHVPALYDASLIYNKEISLIANNLRLVQLLGHGDTHYEPRIFFSRTDLEIAQSLLATNDSAVLKPRVVFVTQTSPTQRKSWRKERFVAAADYVVRELGCEAVFVGTAKEADLIDDIRNRMQHPSVSVAGKTSLPVLSAMLCMCDYAITLDTGTMHVGRAAGIPQVILAPAWSPVVEWLPLGMDQYQIRKGPDIHSAPANYVIDEISTDEVISALEYLYQNYPWSTETRMARVQRNLVLTREQ
jgi:ADP-heptose:LPS heptosyltransferase